MYGDSGASTGRLFPQVGCWLAQEDGWILLQVWAQVRIPGWNPDCMTIVGSPSVRVVTRIQWDHMCIELLSVCAMLSQSCLTLSDPVDCSPPGSSVPRILQARILERVAMPISRGSSQPRDQTWVSYVSCIAGRFFTSWATWEALMISTI